MTVTTAATDADRTICAWMERHLEEHRDSRTGEVDCTSLVEAWDREKAIGDATLDEHHPAWDIAVEVAEPDGSYSGRFRR